MQISQIYTLHTLCTPNLYCKAYTKLAASGRLVLRRWRRLAMAQQNTQLWNGSNELDVATAARALRDGQLVAFPTETVYGLGADATNEAAVSAIFAAKGRPADNPLIVHVADARAIDKLARTPLSTPARRLAHTLWPGALTLVIPLSDDSNLAGAVTAGLRTVGVRVPRHPVAAALLAAADVPVAAPSANMSGRPSATTAAHVLADLDRRIAGVLDGGIAAYAVGVESTVVDVTCDDRFVVLRPGAIGRRTIADVARVPVIDATADVAIDAPRAPGIKYRHYAPNAPLRVVPRSQLAKQLHDELKSGGIIGLLADTQTCAQFADHQRINAIGCGTRGDPHSMAQTLYAALRAFDSHQVRLILAVALDDATDGVPAAVMNRLRKAATGGQVELDTSLKTLHRTDQ